MAARKARLARLFAGAEARAIPGAVKQGFEFANFNGDPLYELFKNEMRKLGVELGLPHHMVYRHPFPSPGLGSADHRFHDGALGASAV